MRQTNNLRLGTPEGPIILIIVVAILFLLSGCIGGSSVSKELDTTLKDLRELNKVMQKRNGCLSGVVEMRRLIFEGYSQDVPEEIRKEMIGYCLTLKITKEE